MFLQTAFCALWLCLRACLVSSGTQSGRLQQQTNPVCILTVYAATTDADFYIVIDHSLATCSSGQTLFKTILLRTYAATTIWSAANGFLDRRNESEFSYSMASACS